MLGDLGKILVDKYLNPCKKCLVKATCKPFEVDCDKWRQFVNQKDNAELIGNDIGVNIILTSMILGLILIVVTFGFGIWKWVELIF